MTMMIKSLGANIVIATKNIRHGDDYELGDSWSASYVL